jgi:Phage protein (N4 Gp49/phage Sf6 gene 66) family
MANIRDLSEQGIEEAIQQAGKTAPRLTPGAIDETIVGEQYYVFPGTTLTVCCLTLRNGYHVTGESAAVSVENFDGEIGKRIARAEARDKIWALEGYRLKETGFHANKG